MSDTTRRKSDALRELFEHYRFMGDAIAAIDDGEAALLIRFSGSYTDLNDIFDQPNYLKQIRSDMVLYEWELRQALIEELANANKEQMGMADDDPDWTLDPIPLGTPKNDHRRHVSEGDDGK